MPFGGFLGSTFNFVFENQLENLQNGDRLYYLARLAGLNFLNELENNSFAKLIMANTDATHLPGDVFSTPGFILEVDQTPAVQRQRVQRSRADGILGDDPTTPDINEGFDDVATPNEDPLGGSELQPEVIRDNPRRRARIRTTCSTPATSTSCWAAPISMTFSSPAKATTRSMATAATTGSRAATATT